MTMRRFVVDAAIVAALLAATAISGRPWIYLGAKDADAVAAKLGVSIESFHAAPIVWWTATAVGLAAMLLRSRLPLIALTGSLGMAFTHVLQALVPIMPLDLAPLIALYTVAAGAGRRWISYTALGATAVFSIIPALVFGFQHAWAGGAPVTLAAVGLAWAFGDRNRTRRAYLDEVSQRAKDLERERDQQAELAAAAERARIARELHDAVAHGLSVIVIQAQAASGAMAGRPATARAALASIVATGRDSLGEMRRLLGMTRPDGQELAPLPGLSDLPTLVARIRAAGLPVTLRQNGQPADLPTGVGLTTYRIVQEALTNALKHAGPEATVDVYVHCGDNEVELTVADTGFGAGGTPDELRGNGLRGMRERVAMLGGTLVIADPPGRGFCVKANLPITEAR